MYEKILKETEKVNILEDNASVIASGGGSPQARWSDQCCKGGDCPVCNPPEEEEEDIEEDGMHMASPKVDVQQRNIDLNPKKDEEQAY